MPYPLPPYSTISNGNMEALNMSSSVVLFLAIKLMGLMLRYFLELTV